MSQTIRRRGFRTLHLLAGAAVFGLGSTAWADQLQNSAAAGDPASLNANGFGGLSGAGINVGIVEASGFANAYYNDGLNNTQGAGAAMGLPQGNTDLQAMVGNVYSANPANNKINFIQLTNGPAPAGQLPASGNPFPAGNNWSIANHATEVTGVVVGAGSVNAADTGVATGSTIQFTALSSTGSVVDNVVNNRRDVDAINALQAVVQPGNTPTVNMSWGYAQYQQSTNGGGQPLFLTFNAGTGLFSTATAAAATVTDNFGNKIPVYNFNGAGLPIANNNGGSFTSQYVDFSATQFNTVMVIAGNETPAPFTNVANTFRFSPADIAANPALANEGNLVTGGGSLRQDNTTGAPSDSYNSINVGAMGEHGTVAPNGTFTPGATPLNYGAEGNYNRNNITSDVSPITGYGRLKTDMVAPGGDDGPNGATKASLAAGLTFVDQFQTTAGGVGSTAGSNGSDTYVGVQAGAPLPNTTFSAFTNPNYTPTTIAGTSFASPLVTGVNSLIDQYGVANFGGANSVALDHRVVKAILLNGAVHTFNGLPIVGFNPSDEPAAIAAAPGRARNTYSTWSRLPGVGVTPLLAGTTAAQFGGTNPTMQPGLDPQLGTGMLNADQSLINYAAGRQQPGLVNPIGWDSQTVTAGTTANTIVDAYTIKIPVSGLFRATLAWDDPTNMTNQGAGNTFTNTSTFSRGTLTDLDLYLFAVDPGTGQLGQNIDFSTSDIDNVEYLYDNLAPGTYQIDVANAQFGTPLDTTYGLAWSVPEPASLALLAFAPLAMMRRTRRTTA